jgi:hypothetical protein
LGQLDAVRAIHFNTLSGSVIVEYVTRTGSREAVLGALVEAGCRLRRSRTCTPAGTPEFPAARGSADVRRPLRAQSRPREGDCGLDLTHKLARSVQPTSRARPLKSCSDACLVSA